MNNTTKIRIMSYASQPDILPIMDRIVAYDKMLTNFLISEEM